MEQTRGCLDVYADTTAHKGRFGWTQSQVKPLEKLLCTLQNRVLLRCGENPFLLDIKSDKAFSPSDRFLLIPPFLWRRLGSNIPIMLGKSPTLSPERSFFKYTLISFSPAPFLFPPLCSETSNRPQRGLPQKRR